MLNLTPLSQNFDASVKNSDASNGRRVAGDLTHGHWVGAAPVQDPTGVNCLAPSMQFGMGRFAR